MPHWDNSGGQNLKGFDDRRRGLKRQLEEHQQSNECTHKENCPICKKLKTKIYLADPTLP